MEKNKFNWNDLYSIENAKSLEALLDRKSVPFIEIIKFFNLKNVKDNDKSIVDVDKTLPALIIAGKLSSEICRLPRLPKENIGFDVLPDYYEKHCPYNEQNHDAIIKNKINYSREIPVTLTYNEVVKLLAENKVPASILGKHAKERKIGVYFNVPSEYVITISVSNSAKQSIDYFRYRNCGNPYYKKRYSSLERLQQKIIDTLFNNQSVSIITDFRNKLEVDTTDMETKFHLERFIKPFKKYKRKITPVMVIEDTVYLEKDINDLITCGTKQTSKKISSAKRQSKRCHHLLKFIDSYINHGCKFSDFEKLMIKNHLVTKDHKFKANNYSEKYYIDNKAKLNEVYLGYVKQNKNGNYELHYFWKAPHDEHGQLFNERKSFKTIQEYFKYCEKLKPS